MVPRLFLKGYFMPHRKRTLDRICLEMIERGSERQLIAMFKRDFFDIYAIDKKTKKPLYMLVTKEKFPILAPMLQERVCLDRQKQAEKQDLPEKKSEQKEQELQILKESIKLKSFMPRVTSFSRMCRSFLNSLRDRNR